MITSLILIPELMLIFCPTMFSKPDNQILFGTRRITIQLLTDFQEVKQTWEFLTLL